MSVCRKTGRIVIPALALVCSGTEAFAGSSGDAVTLVGALKHLLGVFTSSVVGKIADICTGLVFVVAVALVVIGYISRHGENSQSGDRMLSAGIWAFVAVAAIEIFRLLAK